MKQRCKCDEVQFRFPDEWARGSECPRSERLTCEFATNKPRTHTRTCTSNYWQACSNHRVSCTRAKDVSTRQCRLARRLDMRDSTTFPVCSLSQMIRRRFGQIMAAAALVYKSQHAMIMIIAQRSSLLHDHTESPFMRSWCCITPWPQWRLGVAGQSIGKTLCQMMMTRSRN